MERQIAQDLDRYLTTQPEEDEYEVVECSQCSAIEYVGGEIAEKTLEDDGWYFGPVLTLCPDCNDDDWD